MQQGYFHCSGGGGEQFAHANWLVREWWSEPPSYHSHLCTHKDYTPSRLPDYSQRRKPSPRCTSSGAEPTFSRAASAAVDLRSANLERAEKFARSGARPGGVGGQGCVCPHANWGEGDPPSPQCLLPARGPLTPPVRRADTEGQPSSRVARSSVRGAGDTASPWRRDSRLLEPGEPRSAEAEGALGRGRGKLGGLLRGGEEAGRARVAREGATPEKPGGTSLPLARRASLRRRCKPGTGQRGWAGASLGRG